MRLPSSRYVFASFSLWVVREASQTPQISDEKLNFGGIVDITAGKPFVARFSLVSIRITPGVNEVATLVPRLPCLQYEDQASVKPDLATVYDI